MGGVFAQDLERKLGIKDGQRIALIGSTTDVFEYFSQQFPNHEFATTLRGNFDIVLYFTTRNSDLTKKVAVLTRSLREKGALWIAWPKRTSRIVTDLTFDIVQEAGISQSLIDTKVCSISEVWSALRFAQRQSQQVQIPANA